MNPFRRKKFEHDMAVELTFHIDAYVDDLVRSGIGLAEARRRARIEFGAVESAKDECRQAWGWQRLDELRADLRYTLRTLRRSPAFAAIAVLSLALGIGANTAIFGLVDAVLLRVLPVRDPASLVFIQNVGTGGANGGPPYPCFELLRDRARSFQGMAAFSPSNMEVSIDGGREQVSGVYVSGNFYDLLGIKPLAGRALSAEDDRIVRQGGPSGPVAVISRAWWRQRFGGDPSIVGRAIHFSGITVTIVGIVPSALMSLEPGRPVDLAVPMMLSDPATLRNRGAWWLDVVARFAPGVRPERARAEADALFQSFMGNLAISPGIRALAFDHIELAPAGSGIDSLRTRFSKPLAALMILAGLVLLAACVTVANLMLARATARQKEFAVRLAIGARRGRLIRQNLTEALVLVGSGAALGIVLALRGESALAAYFAEGNSKIVLDLSLNGRVLLFTLGASALTGIAFGLLPALRAVRVDPAAGMQAGSRAVFGSRASLRLGRALVVLQVALSMVLLAGAGLFIRSLRRLESLDPGFKQHNVLTLDVAPERTLFGSPQWMALQAGILDRVRRLPGVESAGWSSMTPFNGRDRGEVLDVPGFSPRIETDRHVHLVLASPEYFPTVGMSLLRGRSFDSRDSSASARVAVINQTTARFYFGESDPLGRKLIFATLKGKPAYEIVGVVKDAKHESLRGEPWRFLYIPIPQSADSFAPVSRLTLSVRCSGSAMTSSAAVVKQLLQARSSLLVTNVSTLERQVRLSLMKERLVSTLAAAFGALALLLSCIGLYGVLAYGVARRTGEIGIRMALGATGRGMVWLILKEALLLAAAGILLGVLPVLALGRVARALLYGVNAFDLPAFTAAMLVLAVFAAAAAIVPARRAGRLDPMSALRCE